MDTTQELASIMQARCPGVFLRTYEERRGLTAVRSACRAFTNGSTKTMWVWSSAGGMREVDLNDGKETVQTEPCGFDEGLSNFISKEENVVLVLCDPWDELQRSIYLSWMKRALYAVRGTGKCIVTLGGEWKPGGVPPEIADQIMVLDLSLPTFDELSKYIVALSAQYRDKCKLEIEENIMPELARACCGLSMDEARCVVSLAVSKFKTLNSDAVKLAIYEKKQIIARSGILTYEEANRSMLDVGGLGRLKAWLSGRRNLFAERARQRRIKPPKGVLIVGIPGTGKSLIARAIAAAWARPLVRLDVGALFGSLVGESESRTRRALATAEAVAPCVLWLDEIEKGFSGGGGGDSGTSERVLATILTWLQEQTAGVFVVATANDIEKLARLSSGALIRKGRFDEIFFVDLPGTVARKEIFTIHLGKDNAKLPLDEVVRVTNSFTGSEIEAICQTANIAAFNDKDRAITETDLLAAAKATVPLSKTAEASIKNLKAWAASGRAVLADYDETQTKSVTELL